MTQLASQDQRTPQKPVSTPVTLAIREQTPLIGATPSPVPSLESGPPDDERVKRVKERYGYIELNKYTYK